MTIELSDAATERVVAAAGARGISEAEVVEQLTSMLASPEWDTREKADALAAFIGCGSADESRDLSIHELRDELSASQLRDRRDRRTT